MKKEDLRNKKEIAGLLSKRNFILPSRKLDPKEVLVKFWLGTVLEHNHGCEENISVMVVLM